MPGSKSKPQARLRKAVVADAKPIYHLIGQSAQKSEMLARSLSDIYETIRDFHMCEDDGRVVGCCALHMTWDDMAEIRSVIVDGSSRGKGIGTALVRRCIAEAKGLGIARIFVLTYIPLYFQRLGFREVSKDVLPHKVWSECVKCTKFPDCGETAMILEKL
ncbi:MAG TPA: N-acetyltransferase [Planctomycetota bacterium]|nr:N-acetyltransferase [Planctomycetota bacterium]